MSFDTAVRHLARLAWTHRWRLVLLFAGVLVPLLAFGELAEHIVRKEAFFFDEPLLRAAHRLASQHRDTFMLLITKIGYAYGVIPVSIALPIFFAFRHRMRDALFAACTMGGTTLLNVGAKLFFGRERPKLWTSIAPEQTFSFPSGHAMGSMALVATLAVLAWPTRARWFVVAGGLVFAVLVGASRVYLGVHYPSDIAAGWCGALAWVIGLACDLLPHHAAGSAGPGGAGRPGRYAAPNVNRARSTGPRARFEQLSGPLWPGASKPGKGFPSCNETYGSPPWTGLFTDARRTAQSERDAAWRGHGGRRKARRPRRCE